MQRRSKTSTSSSTRRAFTHLFQSTAVADTYNSLEQPSESSKSIKPTDIVKELRETTPPLSTSNPNSSNSNVNNDVVGGLQSVKEPSSVHDAPPPLPPRSTATQDSKPKVGEDAQTKNKSHEIKNTSSRTLSSSLSSSSLSSKFKKTPSNPTDNTQTYLSQLLQIIETQISSKLPDTLTTVTNKLPIVIEKNSKPYLALYNLCRFANRQRNPPLPEVITSKEWQLLMDNLVVHLKSQLSSFINSSFSNTNDDDDDNVTKAAPPSTTPTTTITTTDVDQCITEIIESIERYLMESTYPVLFSPPNESSNVRSCDQTLSSRIAALSIAGINLSHLGIAVDQETMKLIDKSVGEIGKLFSDMNKVFCPLDKLKKVVDAHTLVVDHIEIWNNHLLSCATPKCTEKKDSLSSSPSNNNSSLSPTQEETSKNADNMNDSNGSATTTIAFSTDTILPILIYTVIRTNPPKFVSNIRYIEIYRYQPLLEAQYSYCLTNMEAAIAFLTSDDVKELGLSAELSSSSSSTFNNMSSSSTTASSTGHHNHNSNTIGGDGDPKPELKNIKKQLPVVPFVTEVGNFSKDFVVNVVGGVAEGSVRVASNVYDITFGKFIKPSSLSSTPNNPQANSTQDSSSLLPKNVQKTSSIIKAKYVLQDASEQLASRSESISKSSFKPTSSSSGKNNLDSTSLTLQQPNTISTTSASTDDVINTATSHIEQPTSPTLSPRQISSTTTSAINKPDINLRYLEISSIDELKVSELD
ncbi:hypothetical protein H4219_005862, partial [Mycoemilia scoparia]